jgi:hypothetical protein
VRIDLGVIPSSSVCLSFGHKLQSNVTKPVNFAKFRVRNEKQAKEGQAQPDRATSATKEPTKTAPTAPTDSSFGREPRADADYYGLD